MEEKHIKRLRQLILENKIIEAQEYIRNVTDFNLEKTNKYIEVLRDDIFLWNGQVDKNKENEIRIGNELNEKEVKLVKKLIRIGRKLNAVNYVKKSLDISLKEAKKIVDALEEGPKKTETIIFGENDSLMVETEIEEESFIEFGAADEIDLSENQFKPSAKTKIKKSKKYIKSKPFTFEKIIERDKRKKLRKSNSGCMLMLTFMIVTGSIIAAGLYFL